MPKHFFTSLLLRALVLRALVLRALVFRALVPSTLALLLLSVSPAVLSGPVVKLCLENNCRQTHTININDATWSAIRALYKTPFTSDVEEQQCIISAITLIEKDVYQVLAGLNADKQSAEDLYSGNNKKTRLKNVKAFLGVLLDNHLISRHYLRNTLTLTDTWTRLKSEALLLQSLTDSQLYILQMKNNKLGSAAVISSYKSH